MEMEMMISTSRPTGYCSSSSISSALLLIFLLIAGQYCLQATQAQQLQQDNEIGHHEIEAAKDAAQQQANRLIVVTVTDDPTSENFIRFNQSIEAFKLDLTVLTLGASGGGNGAGQTEAPLGKQKFEAIKKALATHKNDHDLLVLLVNSDNLIVNGYKADILARFNKFSWTTTNRILVSADSNCWPIASLASRYPTKPHEETASSAQTSQPYLDSRALIGRAPSLWQFLSSQSATGDTDEAIKQSQQQQQQEDPTEKLKVPLGDEKHGVGQSVDNYFQLFATLVYLNEEQRQTLGLQLDHRAELFENLHSTRSDVELEFDSDQYVGLNNPVYKTKPVVVHGSGPSRILLNSLGNYLGMAWTSRDGCRNCNNSKISLQGIKDSELPTVLIGVFIEEPTPFLEYFFEHLDKLNYPKERLHLLVSNAVEYHDKQVAEFLAKAGPKYASLELLRRATNATGDQVGDVAAAGDTGQQPVFKYEWEARDYAIAKCQQQQQPGFTCDYYFALDSIAHLENRDTLRLLIEANRTVVGPMLSRPRKLWSNFWGAITSDGYYSRSHDYIELVGRERLGLWNVAHLMNAYLVRGELLRRRPTKPGEPQHQHQLKYHDPKYPEVRAALIFSRQLRRANVFQFVDNQHDYGHLVDPTSFNVSRTNPDFYQLENNVLDWERKYLHPEYAALLAEDKDKDKDGAGDGDGDATAHATTTTTTTTRHLESPCQDVYWFPLVNELFCEQLIEIMEHFGQWSGGTNDDPRIEGGYESVPTRDIHFKQVGLHEMWLTFLREYVMPIQLKEYIGYEHDPPRTELAFVVRYHPAEQPSLRPHHDSSTYTLNIALNRPGRDYEGGGCRFVRYNCSVTESRQGWALIHPGRLTHYHEGLPVTNGTRYILVTFVDP